MGDGERELAAQLLDRAADDVAAASALLEVAGVSDAIVGFHAQQAVEKAIKAVLTSSGIDYPFTHDLELLAALPITPARHCHWSWTMCRGSRLTPPGERAARR